MGWILRKRKRRMHILIELNTWLCGALETTSTIFRNVCRVFWRRNRIRRQFVARISSNDICSSMMVRSTTRIASFDSYSQWPNATILAKILWNGHVGAADCMFLVYLEVIFEERLLFSHLCCLRTSVAAAQMGVNMPSQSNKSQLKTERNHVLWYYNNLFFEIVAFTDVLFGYIKSAHPFI